MTLLELTLETAINEAGEFKDVRLSKEDAEYVLSMLKEQEAITVDTKVIGTFNGDVEVYCCRDCRTILDPAFHYCPNCGRAVKWE